MWKGFDAQVAWCAWRCLDQALLLKVDLTDFRPPLGSESESESELDSEEAKEQEERPEHDSAQLCALSCIEAIGYITRFPINQGMKASALALR
eukprot:SAG11_NODE_2681_length_3103_cov_2.475699_3_plen_93_part_00